MIVPQLTHETAVHVVPEPDAFDSGIRCDGKIWTEKTVLVVNTTDGLLEVTIDVITSCEMKQGGITGLGQGNMPP